MELHVLLVVMVVFLCLVCVSRNVEVVKCTILEVLFNKKCSPSYSTSGLLSLPEDYSVCQD